MLTEERMKQIEALGMKWTLQEDNWELGYQEAEKFYRANSHLDVPGDYKAADGFALCAWISAQRQAKNGEFGRKRLTKERIDRLERIGMIWETRRARQWGQYYSEAKMYFDRNGNLQVPYRFQTANGLKLGAWVCAQRSIWKNGAHTQADAQRYRLLERIGLFADQKAEHLQNG